MICLLRILICKFCKFNFYVECVTFENIVLCDFYPCKYLLVNEGLACA